VNVHELDDLAEAIEAERTPVEPTGPGDVPYPMASPLDPHRRLIRLGSGGGTRAVTPVVYGNTRLGAERFASREQMLDRLAALDAVQPS